MTGQALAFLAAIRALMPRNLAAAAEAMTKAITEPGCLVRVSFTDVDQIQETTATVERVLRQRGLLNHDKTLANMRAGKNVFELTNGSGIEFACDVEKCIGSLRKLGL